MTSMGHYLEDICGKLVGGRKDVCEILFAGHVWDPICRASVGTSQTDKCEKNVREHLWETVGKISVRSWVDDIYGKPICAHLYESTWNILVITVGNMCGHLSESHT